MKFLKFRKFLKLLKFIKYEKKLKFEKILKISLNLSVEEPRQNRENNEKNRRIMEVPYSRKERGNNLKNQENPLE